MTTSAPLEPADPHESKISPDDPRLHLGRERGRTLRPGPIIGLVCGVLGIVAVALAVAMQPAAPSAQGAPKSNSEPAMASETPPVVPDAIRNAPAAPPAPPPPPLDRLALNTLADGGTPRVPPPVSGGRPSRNTELREAATEEKMKAAGAGVLFEAHATESPAAATPPAPPPTALSQPSARDTQGGAAGANATDDPNRQEHKNAFVDSQGASKTITDTLVTTLHHPTSPYELQAGTIIPAVLITAVNSDLPGPVIGQVRENVFDTVSGNYLLVPQGSRLFGLYDSSVVWGQERVLMCWNRLLFPDGDSINLQCMPAADLAGAAGLTDQVDEHWWRILKGAAISSLLAATAQGVAGNTNAQGYTPTVPQMWAQGAASNVNQVGQTITRKSLDIQPTITVRPGWSLNLIVTKDIVLAPYAVPSGPAPQPYPAGR
jgi:type IV secretory pathway VirB10-like protein